MKRTKNIVAVCHCVINCNSKVEGLSEYEGALGFTKKLIDGGLGIIQLPCPEMLLYGIKRWGHAKEQFDNMFYRSQCRSMLMPYIMQFDGYIKSGYNIKGLIAIDGSPSCGYTKTCSSPIWYGELSGCPNLGKKIDDIKCVDGMGIFMEVLVTMLEEHNINIPIIPLDESNLDKSVNNILYKLDL
ncbi:MAG: CD3072 family TudS-related putative desulfidase [Peptostreptococcaceae bacterium]